jgi:D-glycero-alpha-D-manno-heptose-7-phosphate kinase
MPCDREKYRALYRHLLLLYTGSTRSAASILSEQKANTTEESKFRNLCRMRDLAFKTREHLLNHACPEELGRILHESWLLKKEMARHISSTEIDGYYQNALAAGAAGGKSLGAGGGGLLLCCPHNIEAVRGAFTDLSLWTSPGTGGKQNNLCH